MLKRLLLASVCLLPVPASAQSPEQPYVFPATVGTSPAQIVPSVATRRSIEFCNPNATLTIAVCPVRSRSNSALITCAINGAGSVTIPPSWCWGKTAPLQGSTVPSAWNGVASGGGAAITVFTTE